MIKNISTNILKNDYFVASVISGVLVAIVFFEYIFLNRSFISETDSGLTYSYRYGAVEAIKSYGGLPLWNPLSMTGTSWIGQDVQGNILHLFNIFFFLFDDPVFAYMSGVILYYFISLFLTYFVCNRVFSWSLLPTIFTIIVYAFNPELNGKLVTLFKLGTFLGIPALILIANSFITTRNKKYIVASSIVTVICYYSGIILVLQSLIIFFLIILFLLNYKYNNNLLTKDLLKCFCTYFIITILLSSLVLVPSFFHLLEGVRGRIVDPGINLSIFPFWLLSPILSPFDILQFRSLIDMHYIYIAQSIWKSIIPIFSTKYTSFFAIFCFIGFSRFKNDRLFIILFCMLILPMIIAVIQGVPFLSEIISFITGGHGLFLNLYTLTFFSSACLVGYLINQLITKNVIYVGKEKLLIDIIIYLSTIIILITLVCFGIVYFVTNIYTDDIIKILSNNELIEIIKNLNLKYISSILNSTSTFNNINVTIYNLKDLFSLFWFTWLLIFSVNRIILFFISKRILYKKNTKCSYYYVLIFVLLFELAMVQKFIGTGNNLINTHIFNEASTEYKFLNSLDINDRTAVYWPNEGINKKFPYKANSLPFPQPHKFYPLLGNFQLPFLVPSYSTYVSIILTNLAEFHKNISTNNETLPFPSKLDSQIYLYDINNDLVDYSAIKYIFSPIKINNIKYRLIKTGDYYYIYENTRAHEKIDFIRDTLVTRMNKRIYYDISNIYSDLNSGEYTINKIIYSYNNISFEIDSLKDGYAVIKDTYAKWWDVKINGISSSIFVVNDIFRGIHILKGNNKVVLKYSPRYFYYGIIMFSLGIVLIIFIINFNILRINSKNK